MSELPITSAFNDAYIEEMYESFLRDPFSVNESWRQFFQLGRRLAGATSPAVAAAPGESLPATAPATIDTAYLRKVAGAAGLVQAVRQYGHLDVQLDPLGSPPLGAAELKPEFHGITEADLASIPGAALGFDDMPTAADAVARLRELYSSRLGFEFEHIEEEDEREWFRNEIERGGLNREISADEKKAVLRRLTQVDGLERFLGRAYQGYKRFSVEGTDALVPMMDAAVEGAARAGARDVVIGMAHRGRINVLAHVLDKPAATIFEEFEGRHATGDAASDTGDVKYHLGARTRRTVKRGEAGSNGAEEATVNVMLAPNPSHLEFVDPVVEGVARALQRVPGSPGAREAQSALPLLVHGDASFPGEGVVAENLNLSHLAGFSTGGTLHIIANNQVGFTTNPREGRSTYYASDLAKGFEIPIVHVNGDDAEACIVAVRLGLAYREKFGKDFLVDLVGYRRHGHNETDEPAYTQPLLYAAIKQHPSPREVWGQRLVQEGLVTDEEVKALDADVQSEFDRIYAAVKAGTADAPPHLPGNQRGPTGQLGGVDTAVPADDLMELNERLLEWPNDFKPLPKLTRQLERRRAAMGEGGGIDWGHAEALAWASLLQGGKSIRISGQDVERGTFSHRQAVLHDHESGDTFTPLQHIPGATGAFEIYNSPLSETAVLGFEYGYSVAAADTLVQWEAQFGDFANVAQPIIDQFIASDRAKWGQNSGVVLLLPHGYEGQGPEHSSARLERYLQLCAEHNLRVAYPTTPAQYFHILRRQALLTERRPLVLMQPKSLLRLPEAASHLAELANGSFQPVMDDPASAVVPDQVRRLVFCTGKVYYDLAHAERSPQVAIVRVEELYPWPHEAISAVLERYPGVEEVVWAQEEPKNAGAWSFVSPRLRAAVGNTVPIRYVGRPERASPAEGYASAHSEQQAAIVAEVMAMQAVAAR
ncbi:MAG TPA: 2-oxoglutarate dehydrogenase E1 component [Gemmatimonadaceae bacterium]|nr:2-oxoglutarate dehydrogenase E1 component [Gemmatimonadaceae bacterium]